MAPPGGTALMTIVSEPARRIVRPKGRTRRRHEPMPIDLTKLTRNEDIVEALGMACDLYFVTDEKDRTEPLWCTVDGASKFLTLARDGGGGRFVTVPPSPRVVYASSEGQAGVIAQSVDEFITLTVACPFWRDVLKFSDGGRLEELRRAVPVLEASWLDDDEDHDIMRKLLIEELDITPPDDIAAMLYRIVTTRAAILHASDGSALEPLFGNFTVDRSPALKPYLD